MEVFKHFEKCNFGLISPILMEKIAADIEIYSKEWVMKAAECADESGKHNYNYVRGILENWKANGGIKEKKDSQKKNKIKKVDKFKVDKFNDFDQRDYSKKELDDLEKKLLGW